MQQEEVIRSDERLKAMEMPLIRAPDVKSLQESDTLVLCAGFESRALTFLRSLARNGSKNYRAILIKYEPEVSQNRTKDMLAILQRTGARVQSTVYHRVHPQPGKELLAAVPPRGRVYIDISGMSRLLIVQIVAEVIRSGMSQRTEIVYTEAKTYPPSRLKVQREIKRGSNYVGLINFVSAGVLGITVVPDLSSVAMAGQPIRLVAFPSFNATQLAALCSEIAVSDITVFNGKPPDPKNAWRRDSIRLLNRIESLKPNEEVDVDTFDYRDTVSKLVRCYAKHGAKQKLVIAPTGSKMQSVGIGITIAFLPDLQIVYPTPESFQDPKNCTTGSRKTYFLSLAPLAVQFADARTML